MTTPIAHLSITLQKKNRQGSQFMIEYARNKSVAFVLLINTWSPYGQEIDLSFLKYTSQVAMQGIAYCDFDQITKDLPLNRDDKATLRQCLNKYTAYLQGLKDSDSVPITEISGGEYLHKTVKAGEIRSLITKLVSLLVEVDKV